MAEVERRVIAETVEPDESEEDSVAIVPANEPIIRNLVGASLKDAGKKSFAITRVEDEESVRDILARFEK